MGMNFGAGLGRKKREISIAGFNVVSFLKRKFKIFVLKIALIKLRKLLHSFFSLMLTISHLIIQLRPI